MMDAAVIMPDDQVGHVVLVGKYLKKVLEWRSHSETGGAAQSSADCDGLVCVDVSVELAKRV